MGGLVLSFRVFKVCEASGAAVGKVAVCRWESLVRQSRSCSTKRKIVQVGKMKVGGKAMVESILMKCRVYCQVSQGVPIVLIHS